jgi:peptidoglycan/LPS O-acetylase OafA/YrhL
MRLLAHPVLVWAGKRSYAAYLWHYPVGVALASSSPVLQLLAAGAITFALGEVSYRVIEAPAMRSRAVVTQTIARLVERRGAVTSPVAAD